MPAKKNRDHKPASDESPRTDHNHGKNSPAFPYEAGENLQKGYPGYDEERSSGDPRYQQDFDVEENNINERKDEYQDVKDDMGGPKSHDKKNSIKTKK